MVEAVCRCSLHHGHLFILTYSCIMLFLLTEGIIIAPSHSHNNKKSPPSYYSNSDDEQNHHPPPPPPPLSLSSAQLTHSFASKVVQWNLHYCGYNRACEKYSPSVCYRCSPCRCDPICYAYGDCCSDVIFSNSFGQVDKSRIVFTEDQECLSVNVPRWRLGGSYSNEEGHQHVVKLKTTTTEGNDDHSITKRFYMVSKCTRTSDQGTKERCSQIEGLPPVVADGIASPVYKNIHCARCRGVKDAVSWRVSVVCPVYNNSSPFHFQESYITGFSQRGCNVVYSPPKNTAHRQCYSEPNMITKCNETGQWLAYDAFLVRACASFLTPKFAEGKTYKNIFCYLCNKKDTSFDPELDKCRQDPFQTDTVFEASMDYDRLAYSDENSLGDLYSSGYELCDGHGLYDPEERKCRLVSCTFGQRLDSQTGNCLPAFVNVKGLTFELYFKLKSKNSIQLSAGYDYIHRLPSDMETALRDKLPASALKIEELAVSFNTSTDGGRCSDSTIYDIALYARIKCVHSTDQESLQQSLLSLMHHVFTVASHPHNITLQSFPMKIPWYLTDPVGGYRPRASRHCVKIVSKNAQKGHQDGRVRVGTTTPDPVKERLRLTSPPVIRVSALLTCPQVQLLPTEYTIEGDDLRVPWHVALLSNDSYFIDKDGTVTVCLSTLLLKLDQNRQRRTSSEVMCSKVLLPISTVLLLICAFILLVFRILKSLPQKLYLIFIFCLILTQTAFWIGYSVPYYSDWCSAMGVMAHYFSLCSFLALTVCSYHLYKVFNTMHLSVDMSRENKTVGRYCCFILASPILVVCMVILIYKSSNGIHSSMGYGSVALCFLSSTTAVWIALFIPLVVFMAISFVLYLLTYSALRSNADLETNAMDEKQVHFYFRSSVLVTFVWTLGAVAFQSALPAMRIAFVVAQCCLSLYVTISLVANKRVAALIALACCSKSHNNKNDSTVIPLDNLKLNGTPSNRSPVIVTAYKPRDSPKSCGRSFDGDSVSFDFFGGDEDPRSRALGDGYSTIETMA